MRGFVVSYSHNSKVILYLPDKLVLPAYYNIKRPNENVGHAKTSPLESSSKSVVSTSLLHIYLTAVQEKLLLVIALFRAA